METKLLVPAKKAANLDLRQTEKSDRLSTINKKINTQKRKVYWYLYKVTNKFMKEHPGLTLLTIFSAMGSPVLLNEIMKDYGIDVLLMKSLIGSLFGMFLVFSLLIFMLLIMIKPRSFVEKEVLNEINWVNTDNKDIHKPINK